MTESSNADYKPDTFTFNEDNILLCLKVPQLHVFVTGVKKGDNWKKWTYSEYRRDVLQAAKAMIKVNQLKHIHFSFLMYLVCHLTSP